MHWAACKSSDPQQLPQNKTCQLNPGTAKTTLQQPELLQPCWPSCSNTCCPWLRDKYAQPCLKAGTEACLSSLVFSSWVLPRHRCLCSGWHTVCVQRVRGLILDEGMKHRSQRSLDGTKSQLALMMVAASYLDLDGLIRTSSRCSCFLPAQAFSLPQDLLPWGISFCPAGKVAHKFPITAWWKVLVGGKHI